MLPAKLFAGLTVFYSVFIGLAFLKSSPSLDLYVHSTYFVFRPLLVPLFCTLTDLNFAVLYYVGARIFQARWNRPLSLLHFASLVVVALSLSVSFLAPARAANGPEAGEVFRWYFLPLFLGILSYVVGFVLFAVNLTLVAVQVVRARFATR